MCVSAALRNSLFLTLIHRRCDIHPRSLNLPGLVSKGFRRSSIVPVDCSLYRLRMLGQSLVHSLCMVAQDVLDVPCCKVIAFGVLLEYGSSSKQGECDKDEVSCCEDQTIPDVNGEGCRRQGLS